MKAALALALLAACAGCRKGDRVSGGGDASSEASPSGGTPAPIVASARCKPTGKSFAVEPPDELEIGDAIATPHGRAVALVHRTAAGRVAAVGLLDDEAAPALAVVDLGPTLGDAPPPRLSWQARTRLAAAYSVPKPGAAAGTRELIVYAFPPAAPLFTIPEQRDDSLAFDVAFAPAGGVGLVVWDEATAAGRGAIRAAPFAAEDRLADERRGPTRDASPPESDADSPRVLALPRAPGAAGDAFLVAWIAHRPEGAGPADAADAPSEAPGETRSFGWVEAIVVDKTGAPVGPVRRLTPPSGHVSAFDVAPLADPRDAGVRAIVVARDEGEAVDGSGGTLLRVRVRGDGAEPPVAFATDGLGRGAPELVEGAPPWLAWVGPHEQLRLLPLDASGAPAAAPGAEAEMGEGRPLLLLAPAPAPAEAVARPLVAMPSDSGAPLRVFACAL
jgi:hypothetical protein